MEIDLSFKLFSVLIFLFACSFFSIAESVFFTLDKNNILEYFGKHSSLKRYALNLIEDPKKLVITILIGNTASFVSLIIFATELIWDYSLIINFQTKFDSVFQIIFIVLLIIISSEIIPNAVVKKHYLNCAKICVIPIYWFAVLVYPISVLILETVNLFKSKFKFRKYFSSISEREINYNSVGFEKDNIEESEQELIQGIVEYKTVVVREVMKPRVDIIAVSADSNFEQLMKIILTSGHSRIPVYKENLDQILGIIYSKDLLPFVFDKNKQKQFSISNIARKALFVPETKLINELMKEFQEKKLHIAVAVDEYGGTSGIITLENIIEEIVGELRDDDDEAPIIKLNENSFLVNGTVAIDEVNELLNIDLMQQEIDTIGGFVFNFAGTIPTEGFNFDFEGYKFSVKQISKNRIQKILIEKIL